MALPAASLRTQDRPLFPVEQVFGWGIYNHLNILPNLPIAQVSEFARFVKNHQLDSRDPGGARSPVEMGVTLYRILCHSLRQESTAVVGVIEEQDAKRNLDFSTFRQSLSGELPPAECQLPIRATLSDRANSTRLPSLCRILPSNRRGWRRLNGRLSSPASKARIPCSPGCSSGIASSIGAAWSRAKVYYRSSIYQSVQGRIRLCLSWSAQVTMLDRTTEQVQRGYRLLRAICSS